MCGIAGFIDWDKGNSFDASISVLESMNKTLKRRGPDSSGIWFDSTQRIFLGHTRLSILDLSEHGHQPMCSSTGRFCISFNGEIYNHLEVRKSIENIGFNINWKGDSDTETIIESFNALGIYKTLEMVHGMFAIILYDTLDEKVYLIRDRFGEKPLYMTSDITKPYFFFASDLDALLMHPNFDKELDNLSLVNYMKYGYVPRDRSIYSSMKKLEPGTYCVINLKERTNHSRTYWDSVEEAINSQSEPFRGSFEDASHVLNNLLKTNISNQMLSDVPLGSFLSGGIDSSLITSIMQSESSEKIKTFTIGFEEEAWNEAVYANEIAEQLGTDHHQSYLTFDNAIKSVPNLAHSYSEPFADSSSIPTMLLCQETKKQVTVALTGDAGDELFCGYDRYVFSKKIWKILNLSPLGLRKKIKSFLEKKHINDVSLLTEFLDKCIPFYESPRYLGDRILKSIYLLDKGSFHQIYDALVSIWHIPNQPLLNQGLKFFPPIFHNDLLNDIEVSMLTDTRNYLSEDILVKVDRASMFYSLETRIPFLDHDTFKFAWSLPLEMKLRKGETKSILKNSLAQFLPIELYDRPKKGFSIPLDNWLRGPLRDWTESLITKESIQRTNVFSHQAIDTIWQEHLKGTRNWHLRIWSILMYQSWHEERRV